MKYIKRYENVGDRLWIVIYEDLDDERDSFQKLFNNKESAENYYIYFANEKKYDYYKYVKEELDEKDYLLTVEDVDKWLDFRSSMYNLTYKEIEILDKFELPDEIRRLRDVKKYNL
jgi:hypothetical protein